MAGVTSAPSAVESSALDAVGRMNARIHSRGLSRNLLVNQSCAILHGMIPKPDDTNPLQLLLWTPASAFLSVIGFRVNIGPPSDPFGIIYAAKISMLHYPKNILSGAM